MKQKATIILLGFLIFTGVTLSIYLSLNNDLKEKTDSVSTQTVTDENMPDQILTIQGNHGKESSMKLEYLYEKSKETEKEEISKTESMVLVNKVRMEYRNFNFQEGLNLIFPTVKKIKNDGEGVILHELFYEGTMLQNLTPASNVESKGEMIDMEGISNLLGGIRDPENLLLGMLYLNERIRIHFVVDQDSLHPLFEGKIRIHNQREISGQELDVIKYVYDDIEKLIRIDFTLEGKALYAYIVYFPDSTAKLFGIYSDVETHYKKVGEWKKIYSALNK
ncbi:hypothetical protein NDS46_30855 (plasmid) [Paenibacillus thiaminolyticus]|uniref:hypothetical protein n=1 Tax=Paenibacillus thiaminolyticus TaxID=49283 RepID=UPI00232D3476|nr:hypothetical protein [Paenibacillus thiaminolyticus]WCF11747.1 hypothetical protein NDS46_30855 [Paenibacillus thiaminolyticus]